MFSPERFVVVKRRGTTISAENNRYKRTRKISHFKKVRKEESDDEIEVEANKPQKHTELRRSNRKKKYVERYGHELRSEIMD